MSTSGQALALAGLLCFALSVWGLVLLRDAGLLRPRVVDDAGEPTVLDRALRSVGRQALKVVPARGRALHGDFVARMLRRSGRRVEVVLVATIEEQLGQFAIALVVFAGFLLAGRPGIASLFLLIGAGLPILRIVRAAWARQERIEKDIPMFLELMAVLIASGHTFRFALDRVSRRLDGPLADELALLSAQLDYGMTTRDALNALQARSNAPTVRRLVAAVRQTAELGSPIATILSDVAEDSRLDTVITFKLRAEKAAARASLALLFVALPGILGLILSVIIVGLLETLSQLGF